MKALVLKIDFDSDGIKLLFDGKPSSFISPLFIEPDEAVLDLVKDSMDKQWVIKITGIIQSSKIQCARFELVDQDFPIATETRNLHFVLSYDNTLLENPLMYSRSLLKAATNLHMSGTIKSGIGRIALYDVAKNDIV